MQCVLLKHGRMQIMNEILSLLVNSLPATITIGLSLAAFFIVGFLYYRKIDVEEKTSFNNIQNSRIDSLMKQIELLSNELEDTRKLVTELHTQNISLMNDLREAKLQINNLEMVIANSSQAVKLTRLEEENNYLTNLVNDQQYIIDNLRKSLYSSDNNQD